MRPAGASLGNDSIISSFVSLARGRAACQSATNGARATFAMSGPVKKLAVRGPPPSARALARPHPRPSTLNPNQTRPASRAYPDGLGKKKISRAHAPQGTAAKQGGLVNTLLKVAPWKITGPASGPEWKEVPLRADEYRVTAPGSVLPSLLLPVSSTHPPVSSLMRPCTLQNDGRLSSVRT